MSAREPVVRQVLFYDYIENVVERRAPFRAGHLAYAEQWRDEGKLLTAGALGSPPHGALFVFAAEPDEVDAYVAGDPYVSAGIVTGHRILPWTVVIS